MFSNKEKKNKNYETKEKFFKILKNIEFHGNIRVREDCKNLFELYKEYYLFLLQFEYTPDQFTNYFKHIITTKFDKFKLNLQAVHLIKEYLTKEKIKHPFNKEKLKNPSNNKNNPILKFIDNDSSDIIIYELLNNKDKIDKAIKDLEQKKGKSSPNNIKEKDIENLENLVIKNIDYNYKFNLFQILRLNLLNKYIYEDFVKFNKQLIKNLILLIKKILKLKINIYKSIFEVNIENTNSIPIKNNLLTLINGTKLNEKDYTSTENKLIIKKLKFLMEKYHSLNQNYNRNYDDNVMEIQKRITKLLLQLK